MLDTPLTLLVGRHTRADARCAPPFMFSPNAVPGCRRQAAFLCRAVESMGVTGSDGRHPCCHGLRLLRISAAVAARSVP
jgi:hypothetical protein